MWQIVSSWEVTASLHSSFRELMWQLDILGSIGSSVYSSTCRVELQLLIGCPIQH
jgi:hypothetical protein